MAIARGDFWLVAFPNSDLLTFKSRPVLVVQDLTVETGIAQCIVALIISNVGRTGPTRVAVPMDGTAGREMGMRTNGVIVTDNLQTVQNLVMHRKIDFCAIMDLVGTALRATLRLG